MSMVNSSNCRYERKFFVSGLTRHEVEALVKVHPAVFSEIYYQRYINNIYLDSFNIKSYFDSVNGINHRLKMRIRWYGDLFGEVEKPILEIKIKSGFLIRKRLFPIETFFLDEGFKFQRVLDAFGKSDIPKRLRLGLISVEPVLLNRFLRKYFLSADGNYRITLDSELQSYHLDLQNNNFMYKFQDLDNTIMELKYGMMMDESAENITNFFPFSMTKSSKYIMGIERLNS